MVKLVSFKDFYLEIGNGRDNQYNHENFRIYVGLDYDCGCGKKHIYDGINNLAKWECTGLRFVMINSSCKYLTLIKIKGFFKRRFESLMSTKMPKDSEVEKIT